MGGAPAYALTGGPGTGKHSAAAGLARGLGCRVVDLGAAAAAAGLLEPAAGAAEVDAGALRRALGRDYSGALFVGHLAPYALDPSMIERAVVLRRSPAELEGVYRGRGYGAAKAGENLQAEILGVTAHDAARAFGARRTAQVDTTGASPAESARRALEAARGGAGDAVDWLGQLADADSLRRYFGA